MHKTCLPAMPDLPRLILSRRRAAGAGRRDRDRAGRPVAADAAAVRARPHQSVASPGTGRRRTLVDCGFGDLATRTLWERHFATTLASMPIRRIIATHYHPDHLGNAAWLSVRFGASVDDDPRRIPDRACRRGRVRRLHARRRPSTSFAATEWAGSTLPRSASAATRTGVACPICRSSFDRMLGGDVRLRAGRHGEVIAGHGHSPEHASLYSRGARRADLGRHAAAEDIHQRERRTPSIPTAIRCGASSTRSPRFRTCRRTRWCCRRTACRSAAFPCAWRSFARITTRGSPSSPTPCTRRPRRSARPISFRCSSAASSTSSNATSPWGRRSPTSIFSGGRGKLERRVDADGRYDSPRP